MERLLQIATLTLVTLGNILLGMGQTDSNWPMVVLIAASLSFWVTDLNGWFRLNRTAAGLIAMVATVSAFWEAFPLSNTGSILSIAQLLVYLQLILLFQKKEVAIYWQLAVLSLLQVVVSSLFLHGSSFGPVVVLYLFVGIWFLFLFLLFRQRQTAARSEVRTVAFVADAASENWVRKSTGAPFVKQIFKMGLTTLAVAGVVFFLLPRFGTPAWRSHIVAPVGLVGYSREVELGSLGETLQDPTEVFRARLVDPVTERPISLQLPLYFQGTILTHYENRRWLVPKERSLRKSVFPKNGLLKKAFHPLHKLERPVEKPIVLEKIDIEPLGQSDLFSVTPYFVKGQRQNIDLGRDPCTERLLREPSLMMKRFHYELYTSAFQHGWQMRWVPCERPFEISTLLEYPKDLLPTLVETGRRWSEAVENDSKSRFDLIRDFENRFLLSQEFRYSLKAIRSDWTVDPIEDFMKSNRQGHCEYFASALALMLRSQGIPTRLVVGFRTEEFNRLGDYYQVRQLHAHTWVEAYFPPGMIPEDILAGQEDWSRGAWFRLDPTPAGEGISDQDIWRSTLAGTTAWFDHIWENYVMEMDGSRQRQTIYSPLFKAIRQFWNQISDRRWWRYQWEQVRVWFAPARWNWGQWFSWRGGLVVFGTGLFLVGTVRWGRRVGSTFFNLLKRRSRLIKKARRADIGFYRRFQTVLARRGYERRDGQTEREFAHRIGENFTNQAEGARLERLIQEVVAQYYRVRFGHHRLTVDEREAMEKAVRDLEQWFTSSAQSSS